MSNQTFAKLVVLVLLVFGLIAACYLFLSPYEKCVRDVGREIYCHDTTHW